MSLPQQHEEEEYEEEFDEEEEMGEEEDDGVEESIPHPPLVGGAGAGVFPKPTKLIDEYHQKADKEVNENEAERNQIIRSIRALVMKHPKINPFQKSKFQEDFDKLTIEELKIALDSCKDQAGLCNPYAIPEVIIGLFDALLRKKFGWCIQEDLKKDVALLSLAENYLPPWIKKWTEQFELAHKIIGGVQKVEETPNTTRTEGCDVPPDHPIII